MKKIDYEALFRASPYPYLVMDKELTIVDANDAYLRSTNVTVANIVGRNVFDAFPSNPDDPESTNHKDVKGSLEKALATRLPDTTAFLRYSVPRNRDEGAEFEERYWSTVSTPIIGASGKADFVVQHPIDVTELYSFNKNSQVASIDRKLNVIKNADDFSRAQMHEAMARIINDERGHLRNLFNMSPGFVAILAGPQHVFEMVNKAYYQVVGHRDILNKPVFDALPEVRGQGYEELLNNVYTTGKTWVGHSMPLQLQPEPHGPLVTRYVDLLYQPLFAADGSVTGIFVQGHDVTDAYESQAAHNEVEDRLREGMIAAKMVVWDLNIADDQIEMSDNAEIVLGGVPRSSSEFMQLIHEEDRPRAEAAIASVLNSGGELGETLRFVRPDNGDIIWLDIRGKTRVDKQGNTFAMRGITLDITDRMRATEKLRTADQQKDEFLAMLAHELRNPLAPISSAAQLLKMNNLDRSHLRRTSEIISRQINHMTGLVDDLLDVSRVTRGLITTDMGVIDIKRVIADAIEQSTPLINTKQHHITLDVGEKNIHVFGDHKRLVQVLTNLLNNAAKYTPRTGAISVTLAADGEFALITVEDNGIGIAPELLPRVFDLFTQAERTVDRSQGGLGIGLALVKSLVEIHEGSVKAISHPGMVGSRFEIRLPQVKAVVSHSEASESVQSKTKHILIADDNEDAANTLALLLETFDHRVDVAYSARSAIERAAKKAPDVFLLDIGLPEMDGNALALHLRSQPATANALIVAVTGYGDDDKRAKAMASGFDEYLVKPIDFNMLETVIMRGR